MKSYFWFLFNIFFSLMNKFTSAPPALVAYWILLIFYLVTIYYASSGLFHSLRCLMFIVINIYCRSRVGIFCFFLINITVILTHIAGNFLTHEPGAQRKRFMQVCADINNFLILIQFTPFPSLKAWSWSTCPPTKIFLFPSFSPSSIIAFPYLSIKLQCSNLTQSQRPVNILSLPCLLCPPFSILYSSLTSVNALLLCCKSMWWQWGSWSFGLLKQSLLVLH